MRIDKPLYTQPGTLRRASYGLRHFPHSPLTPLSFDALTPRSDVTPWNPQADEPEITAYARWLEAAFPLRVAIEEPGPDTFDGDFAAFAMTTLKLWEEASKGLVRFVQVEYKLQDETESVDVHSDEGNDIHLVWATEATHGRPYEVGHAHRTLQGDEITHVQVTLLRHPAIDAELSPHQRQLRLQATLLHEFGHALGLEHSMSEHAVMFHQGWKNTHLSPEDLDALQVLYHPTHSPLPASSMDLLF